MSVNQLPDVGFNFDLFSRSGIARKDSPSAMSLLEGLKEPKNTTAQGGSGSFADTLALSTANFKSETLNALLHNPASGQSDALPGLQSASSAVLDRLNGTVGTTALSGRNTSLQDPESAYKMMSAINTRDVTYKARVYELSQMKTSINEIKTAAEKLQQVSGTTPDQAIQSQLESFAKDYNAWMDRFAPDMQAGGVLADTQAAQLSRRELDQSIESIFTGAAYGFSGMSELGLTVDPSTQRAAVDTAKLNAALATNKSGVAQTIDEFSAHFAEAAKLLTSDDNVINHRLSNLTHAIDFIASNKTALQTEFGLGDAPKLSDYAAKALAAYQRTHESRLA